MVKWLLLAMSILLCVVGSTMALAAQESNDPTRPADWQPQQQSTVAVKRLNLTQIIAFDGRSYAIINGHRYQLGDSVDDYQIIRIVSQRVELQKGQQIIELTLYGSGIKRPVGVKEGGE